MNRNLRHGYVAYEVIATTALILVMTVAVAPPLLQNLKEGKMASARSEAEIIGQAILDFHADVRQWPLITADKQIAHGRLVGNASIGGGNLGLPTGLIAAGTGGRQPRGVALGTVTAHLVKNLDAAGAPIYATSEHPYMQPGWNGPYLEQVPLDPWGRPYVVNIALPCRVVADPVLNNTCTIVVASCGPNGLFETVLPKVRDEVDFAGDDVGFVIQVRGDRLHRSL